MKRFLTNLGLLVLLAVVLTIWVSLPWFGAVALVVALVLWMALARTGHQAASVTAVGMSTMRQRLGSASVIVVGIAGVVGVLVALLAMGVGLRATMQSGGSQDTAIVMRGGAEAEAQSVLQRPDINAVNDAPGVARDADGKVRSSAELVLSVNVSEAASGADASVVLRGVDDPAWGLRSHMTIIKGRKFKPGMRELVVGRNAESQYGGLAVGDQVKLKTGLWKVVGVMDAGGVADSEIWADRKTLSSAFRRGNTVQSVRVKLTSPDAFATFKAALASNPQLNVAVDTTANYYASKATSVAKVIRVVGLTVGIIMAIGAVFGALNCMFAAVTTRAREIATLRAIGFRGGPVVVSILLETMLLALAGGVLGAFVAWLAFNGNTASTLDGFTQIVFQLHVSPQLVWTGIKWALAIGFIGGLFPAMRAARLPVTTALRES